MLKLDHIRPAPLRGLFNSSEVWNKEFHFEKGKSYLITAPSGKGKSTFAHIIYGLRADFDGTFFVDEKSQVKISKDDWAELRKSKFSIVFQDLRLFPDLTALDNIIIKNRLNSHLSNAEIKEFAHQLGIEDLLDQKAGSLSYGQRQRVAIIRALAQPFEYLLLDEPFSHLDESNIAKARALILKEVNKQKACLIMTSLGGDSGIDFDYRISL